MINSSSPKNGSGIIVSKVLSAGQNAKQNLSKDFVLTTGSNFAIAILSAIGGILAARLLGPAGRGELAAAVVWAGILGTVATLGVPQALTYFAARNSSNVGSIFASAVVLWGIQSISILLISWVAATLILGQNQSGVVTVVRIYLFSIPFSLLTTYLSTLAQGLKHFKLFNILRVISAFNLIFCIILAAFLGVSKAQGVVTLMLSFQGVITPMALILFIYMVRPKLQYNQKQTNQVISYGLKSYWGSLSWIANARFDQFIMSAFVKLETLGHYSVAVSYATLLFPLSGAFAMVLFPRVAGGDKYTAIADVKRTLKLNLLVTSSGAVMLGLLCPIILPWLFGEAFRPAVYPAVILLAGTVILGGNYVLSDGLRGLGQPIITSIAEFIGMFVTVIGLLVMIPRFGIYGAAGISVISYFVVFVVLMAGFLSLFKNEEALQ